MRPQSLPLESLARGQSAVSYDLSCPRTFRIAKSTQERKKSCDEAIDGGLQSHSLEPGHGSATCQVGDFTQITELQWVQLQNRAKGSPWSQGLSTRVHDVQTCPEALTPVAAPTTPALTTVASPVVSEFLPSRKHCRNWMFLVRLPGKPTPRSTTQSTVATTPELSSPRKGSEHRVTTAAASSHRSDHQLRKLRASLSSPAQTQPRVAGAGRARRHGACLARVSWKQWCICGKRTETSDCSSQKK